MYKHRDHAQEITVIILDAAWAAFAGIGADETATNTIDILNDLQLRDGSRGIGKYSSLRIGHASFLGLPQRIVYAFI